MCVGGWVNDMVASQCTIAQYAHHNRSRHQTPKEMGIDPHTHCSGRSCSIHHQLVQHSNALVPGYSLCMLGVEWTSSSQRKAQSLQLLNILTLTVCVWVMVGGSRELSFVNAESALVIRWCTECSSWIDSLDKSSTTSNFSNPLILTTTT